MVDICAFRYTLARRVKLSRLAHCMFVKPLYSLTLIDNKEVRSGTEDVLVLICTDCSEQGTCITDQPRDNNNRQFSLLVCNCSTGWEGKRS